MLTSHKSLTTPLGGLCAAILVSTLASAQSGGSYQTYGRGCPGTAKQTPVLRSTGLPTIALGNQFSVDLDHAPPRVPAVLLLGALRLKVPLPGGCMLHASGDILLPTLTSVNGTARIPIPIPLSNNADCVRFYNQWAAINLQPKLGLALTNGGAAKLGLPAPLALRSLSPTRANVRQIVGFGGSGLGDTADDISSLFIPAQLGPCPPILLVETATHTRATARVMWGPSQTMSGRVQMSRGQGAKVSVKATRGLSKPSEPARVWRGTPLRGWTATSVQQLTVIAKPLLNRKVNVRFVQSGGIVQTELLPTDPCKTCSTQRRCYPAGTQIRGYLYVSYSCHIGGGNFQTFHYALYMPPTTLTVGMLGSQVTTEIAQMLNDAASPSFFPMTFSAKNGRIVVNGTCKVLSVRGCLEICCPRS